MDPSAKLLGGYLRERRARLDPAAFGFPTERRRTPGLRREEVAQLAHVSATWYTWLEQGRGGAPSADVLDRLARALSLGETEREHLFLLAQGRPPEVRPSARSSVSAQLQRVLDAFGPTPAIVKTPDWTVVAWNRAATVVLADYPRLAERDRNVLRMLFREDRGDRWPDWESLARLVVATVRRDIQRVGVLPETAALIDELDESSAAFRAIWSAHDVHGHGAGSKRIRHPIAGEIAVEHTTLAVDGHPDLSVVVFVPTAESDRRAIERLLAGATPRP